MKKTRKNAFTLIELLAVIVVLAVLALIAVPIVLNIINKANKQSEERSIESYARSLDYAISECMMENPKLKKSEIIIDNYEVKVSSTNETCAKIDVSKTTEITGCTYEVSDNEKGYNLMGCQIKDNYYNYIDGKVVEEKEIVYSAYNVGDEITYNGMKFYVISPSDTKQDYVTLLKGEPLTVDEVNTYGVDSNGVNHVNRYIYDGYYSAGTAYNNRGYGGMAYYTSETCGYPNGSSGSEVTTGCTSDYAQSEIKYVVDAWAEDKLSTNDLKEDSLGYKTRLLSWEELTSYLGHEAKTEGTIDESTNGETPSFVYNGDYWYWTMSPYNVSDSLVWHVSRDGYYTYVHYMRSQDVDYFTDQVRPVINLLKSAIQ